MSNIAPRSKLQHGGSLLHLPSVPSDCCNHHLHQKFCKLLQICQTYKMWLGRDGSEISTILHGVIPVFWHCFARISKLGVIWQCPANMRIVSSDLGGYLGQGIPVTRVSNRWAKYSDLILDTRFNLVITKRPQITPDNTKSSQNHAFGDRVIFPLMGLTIS